MSLAGYSDKHGLSPEKWDLLVPRCDRTERSARSDRRRSSDWMKKFINDVGHYIGREGIADQRKA